MDGSELALSVILDAFEFFKVYLQSALVLPTLPAWIVFLTQTISVWVL